eukprot:95132_1
MASDMKQELKEETSQYSLTIGIVHNKIELDLNNKNTQQMYHGSFNSDDLGKCGFSDKQRTNLHSICKFIESVKKGYQGWKFAISVEKDNNMKVYNMKDDNMIAEIEGVHGVDDSTSNNNAKLSIEVAVIRISKEDDFFPINIIMKLKQKDRNKFDILNDDITNLTIINNELSNKYGQLKSEIITLKSDINTLKHDKDELNKKIESLQNNNTQLNMTVAQQNDDIKTLTKTEKHHIFTSKSSSTLTNNDVAMKQIQFVVQQVKEKFANEKEERLKSTERIQTLEQLC